MIFKIIYTLCLFLSSFLLIYFKKDKPKISIFLPIYNSEKYIDKCIQKIQNQTLKDLEIVAINDYSSDNSLNKLNDLAKHDKRIKIVNNDRNRGLLYSRAMGILQSSGEYLMNMDSDDELFGEDSLAYLYNHTLISKVDIVSFNVYFQKEKVTVKCQRKNEIQKQPNLFNSIFLPNNEIMEFMIWNKLIKREIFERAYITFKAEIYNGKWNYFEDDIWSILVNKYAKSKLCLDRLVYIYNYNNNSLMNKRFGEIEFKNVLYRHAMYKKLFKTKEQEKYLIREYYFLLNRLNTEIKYLLLINDTNIKKDINNIFNFFMKHYNCSSNTKRNITSFLKLINVNKV